MLATAEAFALMFLLLATLAAPALAAAPSVAGTVGSVQADPLISYEAIRLALVNDSPETARSAARELATASTGDAALVSASAAIAEAPDIAAARAAFGELSRLLIARLGAVHPAPKVVVYHCPMFVGFAWWVQPKAGIANPYMGQSMPTCGEEKSIKAGVKAAAAP